MKVTNSSARSFLTVLATEYANVEIPEEKRKEFIRTCVNYAFERNTTERIKEYYMVYEEGGCTFKDARWALKMLGVRV